MSRRVGLVMVDVGGATTTATLRSGLRSVPVPTEPTIRRVKILCVAFVMVPALVGACATPTDGSKSSERSPTAQTQTTPTHAAPSDAVLVNPAGGV